ncbi:helix-turn-helix domain-containing protein [Streptomyces sp. B21-101]|uniref:helix-turn-helix domain-containing protein n=1 Tax=Streptomyces sp. B21-101 TaxID=3039415 RepID=UPI002FF2E75C
MTAPNRGGRSRALLPLAAGRSGAATARALGVSPSTVNAWRRDPAFAEELARIRELLGRKPIDGDGVLAAVRAASQRLDPPAAPTRSRVSVVIPADASPDRRRRLLARGLSRGIAQALGDGGDR